MRNIKLFLFLALTSSWCGPVMAGAAGAEPFNFLFLDANARAVGLSGAYTARAADANALQYNPAGLGRLSQHQATFMHNQYFQDISQEYLSYASPKGWGVTFNYLSYGNTPNTTISNHTGAGLGSISATDMAVSAGYGHPLSDGLSIGAGIKFIKESIDDTSGQGFGLDLGILYSFPRISGLSLGAAVQNIGPDIKFQSAKEKMPLNLRVGSAYGFKMVGQASSVSLDVIKERSDDMLYALGLETVINDSFPVRLGYNTRNDDGPGLTAGLGYLYRNFSFDYAFAPFKTLGASHRLSVTFLWGEKKTILSAPPGPIKEVKAQTTPPPNSIAQLLKDLQGASPETRKKAALELGKIQNKQAVGPLIDALNDENEQVSGVAAVALGQIGDARAYQPLIEALGDASVYVRTSAVKALGILGDKRALVPLKKTLRDEANSVRKATSDSLKQLAGK